MKKLLLLLFLSFYIIIGCGDGCNDCPEMNIIVYNKLNNGDIDMSIVNKGQLSDGLMVSKEECEKLILKYKKRRVN